MYTQWTVAPVEKMSDADVLSYRNQRFRDMQSVRTPFEQEWDYADAQVAALDWTDPKTNKLWLNNKMEQPILEQRLGSRSGNLDFDVLPDTYEPNLQDAVIAKYTLNKFIGEEEYYKELRYARNDKAIYGTWVQYCGIWHEITRFYKNKEKTVIENAIGSGFYDGNYEEVVKEQWTFTPKNVPIRLFYVDDNAIFQPNFKKAVDCILLEPGTKEQLLNKWRDVPWVNVEALNRLTPIGEESPAYGIPSIHGKIVLYHCFDAITRDRVIMGNLCEIIMRTKMLYRFPWLPFDLTQHHPRNTSIYWLWEPAMMKAAHAIKNATSQSMVDGVALWAGKLMLVWGSGTSTDSTDQMTRVYSWEITMKEVSNSVENYREINTQVDINPMIALMSWIDEEVRIATGVDVRSAFEVPEQNLGQTEIKEENKALRQKAIDELEDFWLGNALTMTLDNIVNFIPKLMRTEMEVVIGGKKKKLKTPYKLVLENVKIGKKAGKVIVEEDLGNYGYLEFTDDTIKGNLRVRVITPSTYNKTLTVIEKNKVEKLMEIVQQFSAIYGPEAVQEKAPFDMLWNMTSVAFGIWDNTEIAKSKKQATKDKNMKIVQDMLKRYNAISEQEATTLPPIENNAVIQTSKNAGTWTLQAWQGAALELAAWGARSTQ